MSFRAALLLPCFAALASACAAGEPYDSATKGVAMPTFGAAADPDLESEGDSEAGGDTEGGGDTDTEGDAGDGSASESAGSSGPSSGGNMTWTTTGSGGSGDDPCGGPCDEPPPGPCFDPVGFCDGVDCVYEPLVDAPCDDDDPCTKGDRCDLDGLCGGAPITCEAPHASGGTCIDGACEGFVCDDPWENCDGSWDTGCEVPTGVANQCDSDGLSTDGCWTAYCGSLDHPSVTNFGDFYCVHCSNCSVPQENFARWCDASTGTWFPPEEGHSCGMWLNQVCSAG